MADLHINNNKGWQFKWEEWEDDIIREHYTSNGYEYILKLLPHRNKQGIQGRASKLGIRYLIYNKNYFNKIDTPTKSYWLGVLYADGYVTTHNRWGLQLCIEDLNHIQKLLDCIESNIIPKIQEKNNTKSCSFQINNSTMYNDLISNGVVRNKTTLLEFPNSDILLPKYISHFIRGFFDGDGCVTYSNKDFIRKDRNNKISNRLRKSVFFVCKSESFIKKLKDVLKDNNINMNLYYNKRDKLPTLCVSNKEEIIKFYNYIYQNSDENNRLLRKYNKFQELLCHLQ
jgi:hypothetical protein